MPLNDFEASSAAVTLPEWRFEPPVVITPVAASENVLHPAVREFALSVDGVRPTADVVDMATRIVQAAVERTADAEFSVDVDGALSFVLRLTDGRLILAELDPDGSLDASRYDDDHGKNVKRLRQATAEDLIRLF
jgi:hypothetical protein